MTFLGISVRTLSLFTLGISLQAQNIIDPSRTVDWTTAGIPGGIPNRTTVCATLNAASYGSGSTDATSAIQAALNSCAGNQVVSLGAGTFRIGSSLKIPSNVTLRGAGASQTKLDLRGSGSAAITFGAVASPSPGTSTAISGSPAKGSTTITVASASGIAAGTLLMISQQDVTAYMTPNGSNGLCDWCDGGWPGNMNAGQIVEVTGVSGNTITFSPGLYMGYTASLTPTAYRFTPGAKYAGLEDLKLYANNTGYTTNILMSGSAYSWVKGVEGDFADGDHLRIYYGFRNEVRESYFHDGFSHGPGGTDDTLVLAHKSSANLVENNIFWRQHISIMLEWGAAGNVVAYNYSTGNYHQDWLAWMISDFDFHGAHPMFNLFEGNIGDKFQPDSVWGSSSHSTLARNYFTGSRQYVPPLNSRGALQTSNAQWETANTFSYTIDEVALYTNMVGNISGSSRLMSSGAVNMLTSPATGGSNPACYRIGYDSSNDSAGNPPFGGATASSTLLFHGNNNCVTGATQWDSAISTQTVPKSYYLSAKPSWFGNVAWPPIGPDVTGATGPGGHVNKVPAQVCFESSPKDANGGIVFNAGSCYAQGPSVAPPTNLVPTVK